MFYLYQSNAVERLFAQLTQVLIESDTSPLQQDYVVVENPGLAHWVKMQLANALGIAANIEFPMPSRFFWQIQRAVMPELASDSIFAKDSLSWLIYQQLPNYLNQPEFAPVAHYLDGADDRRRFGETAERRRFQLAEQIADIYDQYLVYRPDWIEQWSDAARADWNQLDGHALDPAQYWQPILWQGLLKQAESQGLPLSHRASMLQEFMQRLKHADSITNLPKQVVLFGFSALPKHQLETLSLLSRYMDVHLMVPNPCQYYWGDVLDEKRQARLRMRGQKELGAEAGNNLLASLGRMGQEFQRLLLDVESIEEQQLFYDLHDQPNLLGQVQQQILNLDQAASLTHKQVMQADDDSIQVVGCHSPMREVEVLHDHLLNLFEQASEREQSLDPQDIVVMIPDVAAYAPYIDAVFNERANNPEQAIPYSISDRPVQAEHPLLSAFVHLLNLPTGRFTLTDVFALLETPAVYRAYDLQESQLPQLREWLQMAGVRWGIDGEQRAHQGLPEWQDNTWLQGFKRLLMGYAVSGEDSVMGTLPVTAIEGLQTETLGKLIAFVDDLQTFITTSNEMVSPVQWMQTLTQWLHTLFTPDDDEQSVFQHVVSAMEGWVEGTQRVHFDSAIPFVLVADGIRQRLQQRSGSQHFMVGKVNFCTLLPMRSIPFKVVAVLGLNDTDYPRYVPPRAFDLMQLSRRLGDRSRRDEDRYLFLEAIVSARQSLWLSYRSHSQKSNDEQTPSVVLAELMDFIESGFYLEGHESLDHDAQVKAVHNTLLQEHPLQPFNKQYFSNGSGFYTYHNDWLSVHDESQEPSGSDEKPLLQLEETKTQFTLEELIRFWQNPARYFVNSILDVHLFSAPELDEDDEPFNMDGLQQYQLKQQWLSLGDSQQPDWLGAGQVAYGEIGQRQVDQTLNSVNELKQLSTLLIQCHERSKPIEVALRFTDLEQNTVPSELEGWLKSVYGQQQVFLQSSKLKGKHIIAANLQHWMLCASGHQKQTLLICQDQAVRFLPISTAEAKSKLQQMMTWTLQGLQHPLPFFADSAWQLVNPKHKKDHDIKAHSVFVGGQFVGAGEREEAHAQRCFGLLDNLPEQNQEIVEFCFSEAIEQNQMELFSLKDLLETLTASQLNSVVEGSL